MQTDSESICQEEGYWLLHTSITDGGGLHVSIASRGLILKGNLSQQQTWLAQIFTQLLPRVIHPFTRHIQTFRPINLNQFLQTILIKILIHRRIQGLASDDVHGKKKKMVTPQFFSIKALILKLTRGGGGEAAVKAYAFTSHKTR